jgi:hypothetical protein
MKKTQKLCLKAMVVSLIFQMPWITALATEKKPSVLPEYQL